jgi:hypothetical protein
VCFACDLILPYGFYRCRCRNGFIQIGNNCTNINECDPLAPSNNCDPLASCTDIDGSYTCKCPPGYNDPNKNGWVCEDIDECADSKIVNCSKEGATCINVPGGFQCQCLSGYVGNGYTCTILPDRPILECLGGVKNVPGDCFTLVSITTWLVSSENLIYGTSDTESVLDITPVNTMDVKGKLTIDKQRTVVLNYSDTGVPAITAACADLRNAGTLAIQSDKPIPAGAKMIVLQVKNDNCLEGNFKSVEVKEDVQSEPCIVNTYRQEVENKTISVVKRSENTCPPALQPGEIVAIVIGAIVGAVVLAAIIFVVYRFAKKRVHQSSSGTSNKKIEKKT